MACRLVTSGQVERQREGRASQSWVRVLALPSPGWVAAGEPGAEAAQSLLAGPGRTPEPRCLDMSASRRAALGQGQTALRRPGGAGGLGTQPGRGRGGVLSTMSMPRADLGQGRDRGLPQVPSDKLTWSLSGGLNRGAEQLPQPGQARPGQDQPELRVPGLGQWG